MIYVLSGDRRDTQAWAISEGLKFVEVKHVQNSGSLPGVLSAKHRVVKLSSYVNRRDHWSIDAKLRLINRRELVQIEEVQFDRFEQKAPEELPLEDLYADAVLNEAEEDFSVEEDEPTPDAPETPDVATSDQEPAEQLEETPKYDEGDPLPSGLTGHIIDSVSKKLNSVEDPPADGKEKFPGVLEIGGALPVSPKFDPTPSQIDSLESVQKLSDDELREIGASNEEIAMLKPATGPESLQSDVEHAQGVAQSAQDALADESLQDTKPVDPPAEKKTRRKKEQVAYDNAYAAYQEDPSETTGNDLAAAHEALAKRFPNDPRLTEGSEDLDF